MLTESINKKVKDYSEKRRRAEELKRRLRKREKIKIIKEIVERIDRTCIQHPLECEGKGKKNVIVILSFT